MGARLQSIRGGSNLTCYVGSSCDTVKPSLKSSPEPECKQGYDSSDPSCKSVCRLLGLNGVDSQNGQCHYWWNSRISIHRSSFATLLMSSALSNLHRALRYNVHEHGGSAVAGIQAVEYELNRISEAKQEKYGSEFEELLDAILQWRAKNSHLMEAYAPEPEGACLDHRGCPQTGLTGAPFQAPARMI